MTVGLSRRAIVLGLGTTAAMSTGGDGRAQPAPERVLSIGLLSDLHRLDIPLGTDMIETSGNVVVGVGAARYFAMAAEPSDLVGVNETRWRRRTRNGRWFQLGEARVTPEMFARPGDADDTDACQAWADYEAPARPGGSRVSVEQHAAGRYLISRPILWSRIRGSMTAGAATFVQQTPNTPVMVVSGSQCDFTPPMLEGSREASADDWSSVGIVFAHGVASGYRGFYWNTIGAIRTARTALGVFVPPAIASVLAKPARAGALSIEVADQQTAPVGSHPWMPGLTLSLPLDTGAVHVTRITEVAAGRLTLADPLPAGAAAGGAVSVGQSTWHSNAVTLLRTARHAYAHAMVRGASTQSSFGQIYAYNDNAQTADPVKSLYGIYFGGFGDVSVASLNIEWMTFTAAALFVGGGQTCHIASLHTEGLRFGASRIGLLTVASSAVHIGAWVIDDLTAMAAETGPFVALIRTLHRGPGVLHIGQMAAKNGVIEGQLFLTLDGASGRAVVDIDTYVDGGDSGISLRRQIHSADGQPILRKLGGVIPDGCIGYSRRLLAQGAAGARRPVYMGQAGRYLLDRVVVTGAAAPMGPAACRLYDSAAGGLELTDGVVALSGLTGKDRAQSLPLAAAQRRRVFPSAVFPRLYYEIAASPPSEAAVGVGARGRRSFTAKGVVYYLRTLTFSAPHGFGKGDEVVITGAGDPTYNGQVEILSVTDTTITYYGYGSGGAERDVPDANIVVRRLPVVDVYAYGVRLPA